jgi:hypothetical protein
VPHPAIPISHLAAAPRPRTGAQSPPRQTTPSRQPRSRRNGLAARIAREPMAFHSAVCPDNPSSTMIHGRHAPSRQHTPPWTSPGVRHGRNVRAARMLGCSCQSASIYAHADERKLRG